MISHNDKVTNDTANGDGSASVPDRALAERAAAGEIDARTQVNRCVAPIIDYQSARFCKRFCNENRYRYRCSLAAPVGSAPDDASLCEWGNGSYGWMLQDLTDAQRLLKYEGRNGATLFDYFYAIANSVPFYERWKDWRFERRIHVPEYIRALGKPAVDIFYALRVQMPVEQICQKYGYQHETVIALSREITRQLARRNRLYLLNPNKRLSLPHAEDDASENASQAAAQAAHLELETASYDEAIETREQRRILGDAWKKLTPVEQFVIEALVIEEQQANTVLDTLVAMDISIKDGVAPADTDRQQLYYFRRKTLEKLSRLMQGGAE